MSPETCLKILQGLSLIRFFPQNTQALVELAEKVGGWCKGTAKVTPEKQCRMLVSAAVDRFDEWPGVPQLKHLFDDLFPVEKYSSRGVDPNAFYVPERGDESGK